MTPPPGNIRPDGRGGLRVTIEEIEHWFAPADAARLLQENAFASPSNPAGTETPHLLITVYPDRRYLALTAEVREVRGGTRDICKVVSALKGEAHVGA
jgi:hypothetical protein